MLFLILLFFVFNDEEQQEDKVSELLNDNTLLDVISDTLILCV